MLRKKKEKPIEDTAENALRTAISLLAYKENTKKELFNKLIIRGYSKSNATTAVEFAVEKGYLSEERYLNRYVESCVASLYGKKRIVMSAKKKGFENELLTEELFNEVDFKEHCYTALKKCKKPDPNKARNTLMRRGFSSAEVTYSLKKYQHENGKPYGEEEDAEVDEFFDDFSDGDL